MNTDRVLVVDDQKGVRNTITLALRDGGYDARAAQDGIQALALADTFRPDVMVVDLQMPRMDGIETMTHMKERLPNLVAILLTGHGSIESAVEAMKKGAFDYLTKPWDNDQLLLVVNRALNHARLSREAQELRTELKRNSSVDSILGKTPEMEDVRNQIRIAAQSDVTILIEGKSGTGKEKAARAIHFESKRISKPLVIVDCTAIPTSLIESEFFGHERGAFTDARDRRIGKFEEADGGTIFLDEIGDLPLESQGKLLRVLQEKEFQRLGSNQMIRVDVRVICATNKDLECLVASGRFREDLYYRLAVFKLRMPSLSEHRADIPLYVDHFLGKCSCTVGKRVIGVSEDALRLLSEYEWPGNIRQLENAIQSAVLHAECPLIQTTDLDFIALPRSEQDAAPGKSPQLPLPLSDDQFISHERRLIISALDRSHWSRTHAAAMLGISRRTLFRKMCKYGLDSGEDPEDRT